MKNKKEVVFVNNWTQPALLFFRLSQVLTRVNPYRTVRSGSEQISGGTTWCGTDAPSQRPEEQRSRNLQDVERFSDWPFGGPIGNILVWRFWQYSSVCRQWFAITRRRCDDRSRHKKRLISSRQRTGGWPEAARSDQAQTGSKPTERWVETGLEPETGQGDLERKRSPCSFGRRWGPKMECQPEKGHGDLCRRAGADMYGGDRGCRRQRYHSSSSDGGSNWGREKPSNRNGQLKNSAKRDRERRRYYDLLISEDWSTLSARKRHRTPTSSGHYDDQGIRWQRYRSPSSDGGSDWGRENSSNQNRQPANCVGRNHEGRRYPSLSDGEDRLALPTHRRCRTPTHNSNYGGQRREISRRPLQNSPQLQINHWFRKLMIWAKQLSDQVCQVNDTGLR